MKKPEFEIIRLTDDILMTSGSGCTSQCGLHCNNQCVSEGGCNLECDYAPGQCGSADDL